MSMSGAQPPSDRPSSPNLRVLVALVIFMGVLIVAGVIVVVVTIVNRLGAPDAADNAAAVGGFAAADVPIPAGCEVVEARADGNRLVLRLGTGARCQQALVVDLATGKVVGRLNFVPAP
jgi:hypothetical protein